jgi:hypothetical protein
MTSDYDNLSYAQLETGARFLASRARTEAERETHLGMANLYARLDAGTRGHGEH